ncbi:MAG: glycosyltransferase family 4 protein [Methanomicrobia archaeon]|nr:glycosyltransferase family 4 protein [Methanomicrobia archaeon]
MKIAYVSTYLPQQCGIATYTDYVIHGLREVSPTLDIKVVAEKGAAPLNQERFEVVPCWDRGENYVDPIIRNTKDADVVHVQHEYAIYNFDDRLPMLLERLKASAKRVIITIHCVRPGQFCDRGVVDENFVKGIAELADEVIVHLDSQKAVLERLGLPLERIHVIPHGTLLSNADKKISRARLKLPEEGKIILMFGFVKPFKGIHVALEVLDEVREEVEDVYLFIAGSLAPNASKEGRDYVEFVRKRIKELKLQDKVIFPNRFFPNEDIPYIFGASDVVLLPYSHEDRAASGSFHLAIGAKKPVIASRIPKFEELKNICDELLVLPYNVTGMVRLAIRLFEDKEFEQYVLDRTERYRTATSWAEIANRHLELYRGAEEREE